MIKVKTFKETISIVEASTLDKQVEAFLAEQEGVVAFNISMDSVYLPPNKIIKSMTLGYVLNEDVTELEDSEKNLEDASSEDEVTENVPSGTTSDDDVIPF